MKTISPNTFGSPERIRFYLLETADDVRRFAETLNLGTDDGDDPAVYVPYTATMAVSAGAGDLVIERVRRSSMATGVEPYRYSNGDRSFFQIGDDSDLEWFNRLLREPYNQDSDWENHPLRAALVAA